MNLSPLLCCDTSKHFVFARLGTANSTNLHNAESMGISTMAPCLTSGKMAHHSIRSRVFCFCVFDAPPAGEIDYPDVSHRVKRRKTAAAAATTATGTFARFFGGWGGATS
jgi:hypothetical protein